MDGFKTYSGIIVAFIGMLCTTFKVNFTTAEIQPIVDAGITLVGLLFAAYGRYKAKPTPKGDTQ